MFPLPSAQTCEARLPSKERIPGFWDSVVTVISGTQFVPSHPNVVQRDQYQSQGAAQAPLLYRQAREARVWVEVEDRAHGLRLQGPRGMSTPLHHIMS